MRFTGEVINHRQAEEQQVWGHLEVCFCEEESYESKVQRKRKWWKIRNLDIIARIKGKKINEKAKVKWHQRMYSKGGGGALIFALLFLNKCCLY